VVETDAPRGSSSTGVELRGNTGTGLAPSQPPRSAQIDLDDPLNPSKTGSEGFLTDEIIAAQWDLVHFGRAPDADYSAPLNVRRKIGKHRATLAFEQMQAEGVEVTPRALNMLLTVHCEAQHEEDAYKVLSQFPNFGVVPGLAAYRSMVIMHVKNKKIGKALEAKGEMIKSGVKPDGLTYGMLMESLSHRDMLVEALQLLEEASDSKVKVPEKHLRYLRSRCRTLGINHPNMRADPKLWVREMKALRRRFKHASQSKIESVRNFVFK
jgi:pentatricopeptide repeat protein